LGRSANALRQCQDTTQSDSESQTDAQGSTVDQHTKRSSKRTHSHRESTMVAARSQERLGCLRRRNNIDTGGGQERVLAMGNATSTRAQNTKLQHKHWQRVKLWCAGKGNFNGRRRRAARKRRSHVARGEMDASVHARRARACMGGGRSTQIGLSRPGAPEERGMCDS
jgi:hypothetical protein